MIVFENIPRQFFYKSNFINELFIEDEYLSVYKNAKLYYLQSIEKNSDISKLKAHLENRLKLNNLKFISKENISLNKKCNYTFTRVFKSNLLTYYLFYLFFLSISFYSFDYVEKSENITIKELQVNTEVLKKGIEFTFLSKELISLIVNSKESNLTISSINFRDSKFMFNIESVKKKSIYNFLEKIENSNIDNLIFNEDNKRYLANASFKISRR